MHLVSASTCFTRRQARVRPASRVEYLHKKLTDFLRSMQAGIVDVAAEPVIQGRVQQLWRVIITRREDGKAVAQGQVRLQNVPLPQAR
jgi:acyl-coenzyme A thioesterase PaaI-like protein